LRGRPGNLALFLVPAIGGPERKVADLPVGTLASQLSWTPDSKWLAVPLRESPQGPHGIWLISVDTGERRRLTRPPGYGGDSFPSISPDGRILAFSREVKVYLWALCLLRLSRDLQPEGEPWELAKTRHMMPWGMAWTGDGREIVYSAGAYASSGLFRVPVSGRGAPVRLPYAAPGAQTPAIASTRSRLAYGCRRWNVNLWRLDTRTGQRQALVSSNWLQELPQYSPDGRKIAFQSDRSGEMAIWACDADGSNCVQLISFGDAGAGCPRWSPDSRWIAFDGRVEGQSEIYVIQADGGAPRRMTADPADDAMPSWSRDGRWIYFVSDRSGRLETWKMPAAGGPPVQVTHGGGGAAFESADGRYVYYAKGGSLDSTAWNQPVSLFRVPVEGGEEVQILPPMNSSAGFAVTAKAVYFTRLDSIQRLEFSSGKVSTVAKLEKENYAGICVSSDDAYVVWPQRDRLSSDLMLVEGFR
jgi:Tol biopolymer transport system component